jgi:methionyl-tRNA formyltransferase
MKVILFADGLVGEKIASHLIKNFKNDIALVIVISENLISLLAKENNIPFEIYNTSKSISSRININFDFGILAWWPKIIRQDLIVKAKIGFVNTHPSLLPFNRGKHYNFWAIVEEAPFGVTLHFVDNGIDTGPILAQSKIGYDWQDNGESLYMKAQNEMVKLFIKSYPTLRNGNFQSIPQVENEGSFHHSSEIETICQIDLKKMYSAKNLLNLLRARTFKGYPGCWFEDNGKKYEILITINQIEPK